MSREKKLTALLEFDADGVLIGIYPNARTDEEQKTVEGALRKLFVPDIWDWVARRWLSRPQGS
jgi:hypothetical protein